MTLLLRIACMVLVLGGASRAMAVNDINAYAGTYTGVFYLKLNSGDYRSYGVVLNVRRGSSTASQLFIQARINAAGVVSFCEGRINKSGSFNVVQIPDQKALKLRTFSLGGRLNYKLNKGGAKGVYQFVNPTSNPNDALGSPTQTRPFESIRKTSDR
jgi:hypothetical protein